MTKKTIKRLNLSGFAEACYDQSSVCDLIDALRGPVDQIDCDIWKLSHQEWRDAIADALLARILDQDRLPEAA